MGLFDKKYCDVCGNKIGLLGNRKLADGNLCKECAKKLSPLFSERRNSTVEEIKEQLNYREENKNAVAAFNVTRSLGNSTKVLLDDNAGKFIVTRDEDFKDSNPDVIDLSQVTDCYVDIDEARTELEQTDSRGNQMSYSPPRYIYDYDFYVVIKINSPYFDEIKFRLNKFSIETKVQIKKDNNESHYTECVHSDGLRHGGMNPMLTPIPAEYRECERLGEEIKAALTKQQQND